MKRNLLFVFIICAAMFGCKKDSKLTYNSADNIYLNYKNTDNIVFSFAYNPGIDRDTIWIPVIISGNRVNHDRKFALDVDLGGTTATRALHYEPLKPFYIMPADSGTTHVPVIIKNIDTGLTSKSVTLSVRVSGGEDFGSSLPGGIRSKTITFSNRLEEPEWWKYWGDLGAYSRTKHQLFLISSGTIDLVIPGSSPDWYMEIPRTLYYIQNFRVFLTYPFDWVKENPDKGYVLTKRANGVDYDFYNINAPTKKYLLQYFKAADKYVFIDESGNQILI
ncbi:protein of unknown function [Mucilaginibacter pineti]|uniref:DUF4843 domain-containing protein n=1 Tax=Mucilaginibacter pineti TaxID=1391627 RepID=A0A1G6WXW1_9SPHI|nr:DUF4843 domain-containing protein [Mucilaginibacter pineti]SDD69835.1 protein of unknown function [Mucilaginibacter pineti]